MKVFGFKFSLFPVTLRWPAGPRDFRLRGPVAADAPIGDAVSAQPLVAEPWRRGFPADATPGRGHPGDSTTRGYVKIENFFASSRRSSVATATVSPSPGFTLVEMLVALAILAVMMAAIGEIFSLAGHATRLGQATLKVMANVRAVQAQLAKDLGNLDTGGYLIIRQQYYAPIWDAGWTGSGTNPSVQYQPGDEVAYGTSYYYCTKQNAAAAANEPGTTGGAPYWTLLNVTLAWTSGTSYTAGEEVVYDGANYLCVQANTASAANEPGTAGGAPYWSPLPPSWRADQLAFLADGNFQSRTGDSNGSLVDYVTSNAAAVWYGQLTMSYGSSAPATAEEPYWPQSTAVPQTQPPSGENAGDFYLGRRVLLLVPSVPIVGGYTDAAYSNVTYTGTGTPPTATVVPDPAESAADITSSRLDIATITPAAIEAAIASTPSLATIADDYCYRFASVVTPAASEVSPGTSTQLINGYFRMTPIVLPGVPSFSVDVGYMVGGVMTWYGPDANSVTTMTGWSSVGVPNDLGITGVNALVFDAANRQYWPTALKISYIVTDPQNRMEGGQVITQIISLPQ